MLSQLPKRVSATHFNSNGIKHLQLSHFLHAKTDTLYTRVVLYLHYARQGSHALSNEKGNGQDCKEGKSRGGGAKWVSSRDLMSSQEPLRLEGDGVVICSSSILSMPSPACLNSECPGAIFSAPATTTDLYVNTYISSPPPLRILTGRVRQVICLKILPGFPPPSSAIVHIPNSAPTPPPHLHTNLSTISS